MTDILSVGKDLGFFDTQTVKAANVLSVQLGRLEYAQDFGIDLKYFMSSDFKFQNASFKAYLVEILANNRINVSSVVDVLESLFATYTVNIVQQSTTSTLIAR